jgi:hypothetical protein
MLDIFQGTGAPVTAAGFAAAAATAGSDLPSLWAVLAVETRGFGYLADKRPKILFERHVFHSRTHGMFSAANPDISNPIPGGYLGGADEYQRLKRAMVLDRQSAIESASWGLGQVMGFNATKLGFATVDAMINRFMQSEDEQLLGCATFIASKPALLAAFQARQWARVAFFYNGQNYAANAYDKKLADAYAKYAAGNMPDIDVRSAQARLTYLGFNPRGVDGAMGPGTLSALQAFQRSQDLPVGNTLDAATAQALVDAAGV